MASDRAAPTLTLAVGDDALEHRLSSLLDRADLSIDVLHAGAGELWSRIRASHSDVVLVRRAQVAEQSLLSLDEHGPAVIVLSDDDGAADRAGLLAAGATGVVSGRRPERELREVIETVASARARGGHGGPDTPGAEAAPRLADFISRAPRMREFLDLVRRVAGSDASLLIEGETGVGKEHLARAIHADSPRRRGAFVTVNCGALPEQLLESELFGHEAGAFTGARGDRRGRFEVASGGTVFLDEVGEMPRHLQVKLLTVLQRHVIHRLGAERPTEVDVRVMAASNRDLEADVAEGRFREDLFFRLNVVPLKIPPLRERREDLPDLVGSFIRHLRPTIGGPVRGISDDALACLLRYDWPGNIRELINVVERALLLCRGERIGVEDLPPALTRDPAARDRAAPAESDLAFSLPAAWFDRPFAETRREVLARFERVYLDRLLRRTGGRVGDTARLAGLSPRSLYDKMKRHGLRKEDYR